MTQQAPHRNPLSHLPSGVSHFLGYRSGRPSSPQPRYIIWFWSFVGAFGAIGVIQAVFERSPYFIRRRVPPVIGSFGASAILLFGPIGAPLAQPRSLLGGHTIAAIIGVCITKLFDIMPPEKADQYRWLSSCLSTAASLVAMEMTGTVFPPAGATALIASSQAEVRAIGWYYIPVIMLSAALMLAVALLVNNIQRQYPSFWLSPPHERTAPDTEKGTPLGRITTNASIVDEETVLEGGDISHDLIVIHTDRIGLPQWIDIKPEEMVVIETLQRRMREVQMAGSA